MLFRLLLLIVLNAVIASSGLAATPATAPTILVYGDSLSAAYGIPRDQGWVALLQQHLESQGLPHRVANASISGETTSGGASRMKSVLEQYQPDIVLLELGANDGLRGLPLADIQRNLVAMIEASQAAKARVVLLGMKIPPNYGPHYTRQFAECYAMLAQRYHLPLVTFFLTGIAGRPELVLDDGLHPTAAAQPMILNTVWKVLQPELDRKPVKPSKR
ncbi:MAG: arylesterase [Methylophilaceae bacterium]